MNIPRPTEPSENPAPPDNFGPANTAALDGNSGPTIRYSAQSEVRQPGRLLYEIFADFYRGRELAWRLFLRNLRGLYRQTFFGLFWLFLPPLANTAMWIFLRQAGVFESGETTVNATVYILAGMILWQGFIDAFKMPIDALNKNRNMISKLNFPRESLLLVGLGEVVFDLLIRMLLLIPAFIYFEVPLHGSIGWAPLIVTGLVLWGMSLGLLLMPFDSLYQDVGRFVTMLLPFWMIITPIIYVPRTEYPGSLLNWVNPASPLLLLARDCLLIGSSSHWLTGLCCATAMVPALLVGLIVYRVSIPVLVERMNA